MNLFHFFCISEVTMTRDTVLQVASVSKFVTAAAMMKLVESGKFDLDTNVNDYLTTWKVEFDFFVFQIPEIFITSFNLS